MERTPQVDEVSLKEIVFKFIEWWKFLISKTLIIVLAGILGAAISFTYAYLQVPKYIAELTFVLENDQSGGSSSYLGLASQFGLDLGGSSGGGAFSGDNLLELMKSRSLVEKALLTTINIQGKEQTLSEFYIDFNNIRDKWKSNPKLKSIRFLPNLDRTKFTLSQDSVLGSFYRKIVDNSLVVDKKDKKSGIMVVRVSSNNEIFSKLFAETLVKEVSSFYVETKTKKSAENLEILQRQTDSVRRELNSAITGVAISSDANPNANPARKILQTPSQRRTVDVQANQTMLTELVKNLEMSKMSLRRETPLIQVIDEPILPLPQVRVSKKSAVLVGGVIGGSICILLLIIRKFISEL
jgi:hypothetical protein